MTNSNHIILCMGKQGSHFAAIEAQAPVFKEKKNQLQSLKNKKQKKTKKQRRCKNK